MVESKIGYFHDVSGDTYGVLEINVLVVFIAIIFVFGIITSFLLLIYGIKRE